MQWVCGAGRVLACRIVLLDEREQLHELQANKSGQLLLDAVFRQLDVVETSYFGLRYLDQDNQPRWLEPRRRLSRQLRGAGPHTLYLAVKFYAADPCRLLEEITRYQVFLQVRQDVVRGRLPVPPDLAPQLGAYVLQSELGDYDPRRHPAGYVSEFRLQPGQTTALEARAAELHRSLAGQSPAAAELGYLDRAKWLELYGADLHPVLGEDSVEYFLGLAPSGVLVLRNKRAVASYYWPRITKLYSKGKYFMLRVTDKNNEVSTYGFETPSRGACRHLWRCCSEQHAFFRLQPAPQHNRSVRQSGRSPPAFTRVPSRRLQRRPLDSNHLPSIEVRDSQDLKPISIPQPALSLESPYRSTCSIPATLGSMRRSDSPRSTRSAPFPRPPARQGLYSGPPSPRTHGASSQTSTRLRSSSIDSHSSNDSRSCRRHRQRSRRTSDAESEVSRGSGRSRRRRRHRSRHKGKDSADETDSKHRSSSRRKEYELVESGGQWKEVQRKQAVGGGGAVQQASVRRAATAPDTSDPGQTQHRSSHRHRRHRKHRSRSRSPSESKSWLPTELKQHLEWELVDTEGMSADQLREIPYTVVQTSRARQLRLKSGAKHSGDNLNDNEDQIKNFTNKSNIADVINSNGGSIRSVSSTISSGRNSHNKTSERRMKDLTIKEVTSSAPGVGRVRQGVPEGGVPSRTTASASNSSSGELIASARVSHEHTDSGLGADQDYAYSSERSSDSAKCPTTGSGSRQHQHQQQNREQNTNSVSSLLRPGAPFPTPHSLSADLAALSLTRRKPPINPAVNKAYVQPSNTSGMAYKDWGAGAARLGRGRAGGSLRSLASVQSEGRATLNKHRGPLYFVRGDAAYAFNRHASNNNFVDSGIFLTNHRQNGGSLRGSSSHHADFYNMNRSTNPGHATLNRYTDANANVKRHGGHITDNSLHIILKPLIESTQLQGN